MVKQKANVQLGNLKNKKATFDPYHRPKGPLENWYMETPDGVRKKREDKRMTVSPSVDEGNQLENLINGNIANAQRELNNSSVNSRNP